jgi:hypothetical protein
VNDRTAIVQCSVANLTTISLLGDENLDEYRTIIWPLSYTRTEFLSWSKTKGNPGRVGDLRSEPIISRGGRRMGMG